MKKILLMIGSLVLLAAGCAEDNLELGIVPIGADFTLPKGDKILIDGAHSQLTVEIVNIHDSRCPANAICVWEGNYGVDLKISDATQTIPVSLCNLFCGSEYKEKDTVSFTLNDRNYQIVLLDLVPYPGTTENDEPKKAVLEILE